MGWALKLQLKNHSFNSWLGLSWASFSHPCAPVTKQYNLGDEALWHGKVPVGLTLHSPCDTDFSGLSNYGLGLI